MNRSTQILILFMMMFCIHHTRAQSDTIVYEQGLPITGETIDRRDSVDHPPYTRRAAISDEQLPSKIVKLLDREELFAGWKNGRVEFDENLGQYWIYIPAKNSVRLYVMSKEGHVVRVDERSTTE